MKEMTTAMIEMRNTLMVRVSELTGVAGDDIMSKNRTFAVTDARSLVAWALIDLCGVGVRAAGILLRRNYSDMVYLRKRITGGMRLTAEMEDAMREIRTFVKQLKQSRLWTTAK